MGRIDVYPGNNPYPSGRLTGEIVAFAGSAAPTGWYICNGALLDRTTEAPLYSVLGFQFTPGSPGTDPGSNQFYLPNLLGKVIVQRNASDTDFDVLGESSGSKTSTANHTHGLQSHTHGLSDHRHGLENHTHSGTTNLQSTNHTHSYGASNANGTGGNVGLSAGGSNYALGYATAGSGVESLNHVHDITTGNPGGHAGWTSPNTDTSGGPSNNTSAASSVGLASGNLQPYIVLNYLIKA